MRKALVKIDVNKDEVNVKLDITKLREYEVVYLDEIGDIWSTKNKHLPWICGGFIFCEDIMVIMELGDESSN